MSVKTIRVDDWLAEENQDPEFRKAVAEMAPAYQLARLRIMRGLTQKELAEKVGTKQSGIARLESGKGEPNLASLKRIAQALDCRLEIRFVPNEEPR